jgi:hypothetical protein
MSEHDKPAYEPTDRDLDFLAAVTESMALREMSISSLASLISYSRTGVSKVINCRTPPSRELMWAVAEILCIDITYTVREPKEEE